ncbi:MAG: T9SS type A sorting domain-containing protein [Bacteroidota bacterium]
MLSRTFTLLMLSLLGTSGLWAQTRIIQDNDLEGGQTYTWSADTTYVLDGLVYLETGGVLNIEPGTVIQADGTPTTGDNTSALIITRDAQIFAEGTASEPIVFTVEGDDLSDPTDFTIDDRGLWGGLIILGDATIARTGGETGIEGIDAGEMRARYGGNEDGDNSGTLRYVSIRHGGTALTSNNEINGLTLGGVGSATTIEYIEVFANFDDGIEFFGGTVSVKFASVAFCGDDGIDYDFGYRGNGQFWFVIQEPTNIAGTGRCGEHDGASPDGEPPFAQPNIYNATYIGVGTNATVPGGDAADGNAFLVLMRDNAGGFYNNSIFLEGNGSAIAIEDRSNTTDGDAFARLQAGDLDYNDNFFFGFGAGSTASDLFIAVNDDEETVQGSSTTVANTLGAANTIANPNLGGISRTTDGGLDPRINAGSDALGGATPSDDGFFTPVTFYGAFGNSNLWLEGWTALDDYGYLGDLVTPISTTSDNCITITDNDLEAGQTYDWGNGNCYLLDGLVYLEEDGVLNIEAGTPVFFKGANNVTTGDNTSALIITRDAQIFAEGTADAPIIFTAEEDDLADPTDFTFEDRGAWGGLIILGDATIARTGGETGIEGIDAGELRARYGGTEDDDDSGVLRYVSIRHGGTALTSNNEINGLTLGGVGSGTEMDYIEIFANFDDGIEFFGGTVDVKHLSVAFCGDDAVDYDFGYRGRGQFWFALQEPAAFDGTGRCGEHDGASPDGEPPFAQPNIYNATYVGVGTNATPPAGDAADGNAFLVLMRDNAGGFYTNSVFVEGNGAAIAIEDRSNTTDGDAFARLQDGDLGYTDNYFFGFGNGNTASDIFIAVNDDEETVPTSSATVADILGNANTIANPGLAGISRTANGGLDPRINAGEDALGGGTPSDDDFFNPVTYRGAFGNSNLWLSGWTALDEYGYLGDLVTPTSTTSADCIAITDNDLQGGQTYTWGGGNCYLLDGLVYLEEDGELNIEAGTPIFFKGANNVTTGDNTSALIITRDAQIFADGTADEPIIFTAEDDDLSDPFDFTIDDAGAWGGLIILGDATIARTGGETGIEGIDAGENRARYGGSEDDDDSGRLRYVSIRHGGTALTSNNEINGLTLGGVGSGTEIDFVEVFANFDDGIEFFGGTVDVKHAAVAFCGDDGYDYDFGYRGRGQYWFSLQGVTLTGTGRAGEHDGASPDGESPFAQPTIFNATYIGIGENATSTGGGDAADQNAFAVLLRDNAGGFYNNSIFADFNGAAIAIEDRDNTTDGDAFARLQAGDLAFSDNIFFGFGAGDTPQDLFLAVNDDEEIIMSSSMTVADNFSGNNNIIADPILQELDDREMLDPRPSPAGPAASGAPAPADDFFDTVPYYGAFAPGNGSSNPSWLEGWSAIDEYGEIFNTTGVGSIERAGFVLDSPVPNPAREFTTIMVEMPSNAKVDMILFDVMGRPVQRVLTNEFLVAGEQQIRINTSNLAQGNYYVMLRAQGVSLVQKLIIAQ